MRKHPLIPAIAAVVALAATAAPANAQFVFLGGSAKHHHAVTLGAVKKATKKFQRLSVAKKAGYAILKDTQGIACIDNPGVGAMGVHYVKGPLVGDGKLTPKTPEALVYEPRHGRLRLVAVEYVVFQAAWDANHSKPPKLFGQEFMLQTAPNRFGLDAFYMLHAWIYKHNPAGKFEPWNPRVHCPAA
jgi:hypothetical protein